ncbi:uncharacterized protein DEA37_0015229 [Paragonimus westermani]|uniref:Uncharacterized protein n=1 Tax=Paragonimus westermani TaxID=34504 RepID=A0A5J4NTQ1_9TREM|nr:uncharacterized protein DEA37_0015229 [Paragonimus westermani]
MRSILLYGSETWPVRKQDINRLAVFDHRCLRHLAHIKWADRVSNAAVRRRVFRNVRDARSIGQVVTLHRLRWLGHVPRMPTERLPYRALYTEGTSDWVKPRGGQATAWSRNMKTLSAPLNKEPHFIDLIGTCHDVHEQPHILTLSHLKADVNEAVAEKVLVNPMPDKSVVLETFTIEPKTTELASGKSCQFAVTFLPTKMDQFYAAELEGFATFLSQKDCTLCQEEEIRPPSCLLVNCFDLSVVYNHRMLLASLKAQWLPLLSAQTKVQRNTVRISVEYPPPNDSRS